MESIFEQDKEVLSDIKGCNARLELAIPYRMHIVCISYAKEHAPDRSIRKYVD